MFKIFHIHCQLHVESQQNIVRICQSNQCSDFNIQNLSDSNGIPTHNHLDRKRTLNHLAKLDN